VAPSAASNPPSAPAEPAADPEPTAPEPAAEPPAAAVEPSAAAADAPDAGADSVMVQPEATAAAPSPEPAAAEVAAGADEELSDEMLAAADQALNETSEPEVALPEAATPTVTSIAGVQALIRQGKLDEAINAVRLLRRKMPKSAELPYILGDLYFDRGWWSDGLAKYREAISMNRGYRTRLSVQRNAIKALADDRTYPRARALLAKDVGKAAVARLRKAAKTDPSKVVRKRAGSVLARM
jgi:tetratricopeptide (TPR) repeat protein